MPRPNVKTAILSQKALFEQVEPLAREMNVSQSQLFALALEDLLAIIDVI